MRPPTPRQLEALHCIQAFLAERGHPPTYAEIAQALGLRSANAAAQHVRLLERKGYLEVLPGVARGIRLVENALHDSDSQASPLRRPEDSLPLVGRVAAGRPLLAAEHIEDTIACSASLFRPRAHFLLRVQGDSMIEADIRPDDLLAIHKTPEVSPGQIAVVRLEDEVTVKTWRRRQRFVILEPANPDYQPMVIDPKITPIHCEGLVVGLIRPHLGEEGVQKR